MPTNNKIFIDVLRNGQANLSHEMMISQKKMPTLDLSKKGRDTIHGVADIIVSNKIPYEKIFCSSTPRAYESAQIIASKVKLRITKLEELNEIKMPEGNDFIKLMESPVALRKNWTLGWHGLESVADFLVRTKIVADLIMKRAIEIQKPLLVIGHEETVWGFRCCLQKLTMEEAICKPIEYGEAVRFVIN